LRALGSPGGAGVKENSMTVVALVFFGLFAAAVALIIGALALMR
jgi:hypothetical protein